MVIYRAKMHAALKRNCQLMPALKWLRLLMNHIPDKHEHLQFRRFGESPNPVSFNSWTPASAVRRIVQAVRELAIIRSGRKHD